MATLSIYLLYVLHPTRPLLIGRRWPTLPEWIDQWERAMCSAPPRQHARHVAPPVRFPWQQAGQAPGVAALQSKAVESK